MLQVAAQPPKSAAAATMPCAHSPPPVQMAIEVNVPRASGHVMPPSPVLDGGSPVGTTTP
eukprot:2622167-Prymnesium_polylepis.1